VSYCCKLFVSEAGYFHLHRLALAFSALCEPGTQPFGKTLGSQSKAGFHFALADRQGVVKFRGIGEIPHAKLVEPFQGASAALPANHHIHLEFLGVHPAIIALR
jgi:hypothetical protein